MEHKKTFFLELTFDTGNAPEPSHVDEERARVLAETVMNGYLQRLPPGVKREYFGEYGKNLSIRAALRPYPNI